MSSKEVHDILGNPDETKDSSIGGLKMTNETWNGKTQTITAMFVGDKMVLNGITPNKK